MTGARLRPLWRRQADLDREGEPRAAITLRDGTGRDRPVLYHRHQYRVVQEQCALAVHRLPSLREFPNVLPRIKIAIVSHGD